MEAPGYRFLPSDMELIGDYLGKKVAGVYPPTWPIKEAPLYGKDAIEPQQLFSLYGRPPPPGVVVADPRNPTAAVGDLYFFTVVSNKFESGDCNKKSRLTGSGSWKAQKTHQLKDASSNLVGLKTVLNFIKEGSADSWIMHEYRLPDSAHHQWTVCRIRRGRSKNTSIVCVPEAAPTEVEAEAEVRADDTSLPSADCGNPSFFQNMLTCGDESALPSLYCDTSLPSADCGNFQNMLTCEDESALPSLYCCDDDDVILMPNKRARTSPAENTPTPPPMVSYDSDIDYLMSMWETVPLSQEAPLPMDDPQGTLGLDVDGLGIETSIPPPHYADDHQWHVPCTSTDPISSQCADHQWLPPSTSMGSFSATQPITQYAEPIDVEHQSGVVESAGRTSTRPVVASSSKSKRRRPSLDDPVLKSLFIRK